MDKVLKGQVQLYGGSYIIKISNDLYKTCIENTPQFRNEHKNDSDLIYDLKNNKINAMFWLYENDNNKKKKRIYYLFFRRAATVADVVHECVHWKNAIFNYHGVLNTTVYGEDEHEAYFLDHLVNYVFKNIHQKNTKLYNK